MKVVGSSSELGAWSAAAAPLMVWGDGDIWSLVLPFSAGEHEFKASGCSSAWMCPAIHHNPFQPITRLVE
jgi:hypothetical protein